MSGPWRVLIDAWRRGGAGEIVRGIRCRAEVHRLRSVPLDPAYRQWLARNGQLWLQHAARDAQEPALVLRVQGTPTEADATADAPPRGKLDESGAFVVVVGASDTLRPGALHLLGSAIRDGAEVAYADEDVDTGGGPGSPFLKPAWSELLALTQPSSFPGFPVAVAAPLWTRIQAPQGPWAERVLRLTEQARRIAHVPLPLVTRSRDRVAGSGYEQVVRAALERRGVAARAEAGATAGTVALLPEPTEATVSVLIPTRDRPDLLETLGNALEHEAGLQPLERIWLDHATESPAARTRLREETSRPDSRLLRFDGAFNFSRMINAGARAARGEYLLLLNNDVEPTAPGWIRDLAAAAASLPGVTAVGPMLVYPDGTIQHAGIGLGIGTISGHPFRGTRATSPAPCVGPWSTREVSAVTGACLLVRRSDFLAVDGLDEERLPVSFSDVDLCLKLRRRGTVLVHPDVRLVHHETLSRSPTLDPREIAVMRSRWATELGADPYLPPALSRLSERPLLAPRMGRVDVRTWSRG